MTSVHSHVASTQHTPGRLLQGASIMLVSLEHSHDESSHVHSIVYYQHVTAALSDNTHTSHEIHDENSQQQHEEMIKN